VERLLGSGLSTGYRNPEFAHAKNIFRKLGEHKRKATMTVQCAYDMISSYKTGADTAT
jgi:hypothetical protein